jgi:sensor domain CHASE-containing protein
MTHRTRLESLGFRAYLSRAPSVFTGALTTLAPVTDIGTTSRFADLKPLWRHAVWLAVLFVVCGIAVSVRLDVQQTRKDLDRNARMEREARVMNERLRLELDARRRVKAVQEVADAMHLGPGARVVRIAAEGSGAAHTESAP